MKPLAALTLALVLQPAAAEDMWAVMDQGIITAFNSGVTVSVMFEVDQSCDAATLLILGNPNIERVGMIVDDVDLGSVDTVVIDDVVFVSLTKTGLSAVAHGNNWIMTTDQGNLPISLKGSRKALAEAYGNCMEMQPYKRIFPDAKLVEY